MSVPEPILERMWQAGEQAPLVGLEIARELATGARARPPAGARPGLGDRLGPGAGAADRDGRRVAPICPPKARDCAVARSGRTSSIGCARRCRRCRRRTRRCANWSRSTTGSARWCCSARISRRSPACWPNLIGRRVLLLDGQLQASAMAVPSEVRARRSTGRPRPAYVSGVLATLAGERRPLRVPPMPNWGIEAVCVLAPVAVGDAILGYLAILRRARAGAR